MKFESILPDQSPTGEFRWHGALDGMHGKLVYGWVFDSRSPNSRAIVEICLDDTPVGCVIADVARTDLAERIHTLSEVADVCHGFVADLGALSSSSRGILSARVANTAITLPGAFSLDDRTVPPPTVVNNVVGDGGLRLHGWATDPGDPKRTLTVRAFVGQEMVAQATANLTLPMARAYVDGSHGFDLALPESLADGNIHQVRVVDEKGVALNGSPLTVCCSINGIASLLPSDADSLLLNIADNYERHLPRSVPLSTWPAWSARFDAAPPSEILSLKVGVIVTGENCSEAIERTGASLALSSAAVRLFTGVSFASLLAEALASGCDIVCSVRAGDTVAPHAFNDAEAAFALPGAQLVYTDSEFDSCPWFKPAWNLDYALASDFPLELLLVRSELAKTLPAVDSYPEFAWAALASACRKDSQSIIHIPKVLYQRRSALTEQESEKRDAAALHAARAIDPALSLEQLARPSEGQFHAARRVRAALPADASSITVSLIIPTRDRADLLQRCISTLLKYTPWERLEILVIDNGSVEAATHEYFLKLAEQGVRVLAMPGPFNYADLNNRAVAQASGEIVGLINNDIEALHTDWLEEIISQLLRRDVGAVGAKLLWPNGMVQHGGILLGVGNVAGHFGNQLGDADWGNFGRNQLVQQVSGCTAACLFMRRQDFIDVGGMDSNAFPVAFNDVDLCLKIRSTGKSIIWTPFARMLHAESASRGHEDTPQKKARAQREVDHLRKKWGHILQRDPSYNPNLNLDPNSHAFGGLSIPPRSRAPRIGALV